MKIILLWLTSIFSGTAFVLSVLFYMPTTTAIRYGNSVCVSDGFYKGMCGTVTEESIGSCTYTVEISQEVFGLPFVKQITVEGRFLEVKK